MRILNESEILEIKVRQQILKELDSPENQARKAEAFKRYQCYKDMISGYVVEQLKKQFDESTIQEMQYCIANISLVRKCIDKLARVYSNGVKREVQGNDKATKKLDALAKELGFNAAMKQDNRYLKLQRNAPVYVKPCPTENGKWTIKIEPLVPYCYDVVEQYYDRTKPMVYILSDYNVKETLYTSGDAATVGRTTSVLPSGINKGDNVDQAIADTPSDAKSKEFVWWSNNYHFTTNGMGEIISESENGIDNMIGEMPIVNMSIDQDGQFWAIGGSDLVDGAILVNSILTHNQHVAVTQGYGQFYMKGKNLPRNVKVGPSKAIIMEYQEGEPVPEIGFASANPNIDALRGLIESYIALLLTTNNLSTSAVSSQLSGATTAPSGIAMILDKAESMEDVTEQREIFANAEPEIWEIVFKWMQAMNDNLKPELKENMLPPVTSKNMAIKFMDSPVIMSETEKLNNLKLRKELGLDSMIDLIMKDNPDYSKEQAEMKLKEILENKINDAMSDSVDSSKEDDSSEDSESNVVDINSAAKPDQPSVAEPDVNIQKTALNGAQVTSMVDVVSKVALGLLPRDAAVNILFQAFNLEIAEADKILGSAGKSFKVEQPNGSKENNSKQQPDQLNPRP
jgi:hypothetical protein